MGYLAIPHRDKVGAEHVISHCAGWDWNTVEDGEPSQDIMGADDWMLREGLPAAGSLKRVLVIRPALLTNGDCCGKRNKKEVLPSK
jgi:hypothetical protein